MPDTIEVARKLIAERLSAIEAEATQLQQALNSLGERDGVPSRGAGRPRRRRASGKRPRRAQARRGQRREQLLAAIEANPGTRPSELAGKIGVSPSQVHGLIRKARAEKLIVKKGAGYTLRK
jgi:hypothetical protein